MIGKMHNTFSVYKVQRAFSIMHKGILYDITGQNPKTPKPRFNSLFIGLRRFCCLWGFHLISREQSQLLHLPLQLLSHLPLLVQSFLQLGSCRTNG